MKRIKQAIADAITAFVDFILAHVPDSWAWAEKPNAFMRLVDRIDHLAPAWDYRLQDALHVAIQSPPSRELGAVVEPAARLSGGACGDIEP